MRQKYIWKCLKEISTVNLFLKAKKTQNFKYKKIHSKLWKDILGSATCNLFPLFITILSLPPKNLAIKMFPKCFIVYLFSKLNYNLMD